MGYARYPFRDFETYFRIVIGLDEDNIQLILKQNSSNFVTYELSPRFYTIKDSSEAVYTLGHYEGTLKFGYDDITWKTEFILTRFGSTFGTLRFDHNTSFKSLLKITPNWAYEPTNAIHADTPDVYTSDKTLNLNTLDKIHLKCEIIDGSVVNGLVQQILFSFVLDETSGNKLFCQPKTIRYKKNRTVLNTITFS